MEFKDIYHTLLTSGSECLGVMSVEFDELSSLFLFEVVMLKF